jgi:hypothetical protein
MNEQATTNTSRLVDELRAMVPLRPLGLSEAYGLAERQATKTLELLRIREPGRSLGWITELPRVEVKLVPRYKMNGLSGVTSYSRGRYLLLVNRNDAHARRRWTLAHEFKHLLDYTKAKAMYKQLGYGDKGRQAQQIERVCDHFAASLLMPRMWVKRAYGNGIQDVTALAGMFNVSEEAMHIRLTFLGLIDAEPHRITRSFFRHTGWLREWGPPPVPEFDLTALRASST